jgi:hypothetical protein
VNESMHNQQERKPPRTVPAALIVAYTLVLAAILDVGLGIWHRHQIDLRWDHLRRTSYPPLEAYETLPIDMDAVSVRLPVDCLWITLQVASLAVFMCHRRSAGRLAGCAFLLLWAFSLLGILELTFSILSIYLYQPVG